MKTELHQDALNDAGWKLLDELQKLMDVVPNRVFNNLKPALAAAIEVYQLKATPALTGLPPRSRALETQALTDLCSTFASWDGEGLPPVGLEVEAWYSMDTLPGWKPFKLKYYSEESVVFEGMGETYASRETFDRYGLKFRPIRTAEQIAAESHRAKFVGELNRLWDADTKRSEFIEAVYNLVLEAGAKP